MPRSGGSRSCRIGVETDSAAGQTLCGIVAVMPHMTDRNGASEPFEASKVDELLRELDELYDPEPPDVSVSDEDGWVLSAFPSGLVIWENLESDDGLIWHARDVSRDRVRELFLRLGDHDRSAIYRLVDWQPGYG